MVNKRLVSRCLGVFVDDVWLSGVQSAETPTEITVRPIPDTGRIQSKQVAHNPRMPIEITLTRVLSDLAEPFYMPASLADYDSSFLLANTNIGMSGWDSLKEYKLQIVFGQEDESYLGASSSTYSALKTYDYCLLSGLSYRFAVKEPVVETVTLVTYTSSTDTGGLYSSLALPSFPESANLLRDHHIDLNVSSFPTLVDTLFDNGFNAAEGENPEHGKYALTEMGISLGIEYTELTDRGRPRGSVTPSTQNRYKFVSNTTVETNISGYARQENIDQAVDDNLFNDYPTPDEPIKLVSQLGVNYYVWDLGDKNFVTGLDETGANAPDGASEFNVSFANRRSDFIPYTNSSVLTLTQSGNY